MADFIKAGEEVGIRLRPLAPEQRVIPANLLPTKSNQTYVIRRFEVADTVQHAYAAALMSYNYRANGASDPIGSTLADGQYVEGAESIINFLTSKARAEYIFWDTTRDKLNNRIGAVVGQWMHDNGVSRTYLPDILAYLDQRSLLAYPLDLEIGSQTKGIVVGNQVEMGRSGGVNTTVIDQSVLNALDGAKATNAWQGASGSGPISSNELYFGTNPPPSKPGVIADFISRTGGALEAAAEDKYKRLSDYLKSLNENDSVKRRSTPNYSIVSVQHGAQTARAAVSNAPAQPTDPDVESVVVRAVRVPAASVTADGRTFSFLSLDDLTSGGPMLEGVRDSSTGLLSPLARRVKEAGRER